MAAKLKHALEPWQASKVYIVNQPSRAVVHAAAWGGSTIADCGELNEQTEANAKLMAAAPNLL